MKKYKHKETGAIVIHESEGKYTIESWGKLQGNHSVSLNFNFNSHDWEFLKEEITIKVYEPKEEPNYLITAFKNKRGQLFSIRADGLYYCETWEESKIDGLTLESCLDGDELSIFSIKSKEGKEFTIGDSVFFQNFDIKGEVFIIDNFFINKEDVVLARSGKDRFAICENIRTINKVKSPIYTTTDGVDVFKGDVIQLYLLTEDLKTQHKAKIDYFNAEDRVVADRYLTFTSAENRDKYIKEHTYKPKPVFTSADGKELFMGDYCYVPQINFKNELLGNYIEMKIKSSLIIGNKVFSTKELAQEYIDNNKPKYSLADVNKSLKDANLLLTPFGIDSILKELKKLGK